MSRLKKTFKFIAVGYFWPCLAAAALLIAITAYAIVFVEQQGPLTKVSLDEKPLVWLSGGIYQLKPWGRKDPRASCGIYIQRKISSQRWLVAKQEDNLKYLKGGEVDLWSQISPKSLLHVICRKSPKSIIFDVMSEVGFEVWSESNKLSKSNLDG